MRKAQAASEQTLSLFDLTAGLSEVPRSGVRPDTISAQTPEALPTEGPVNGREGRVVRQTVAHRETSAEPPADLPDTATERLAERAPASPSAPNPAAVCMPVPPDEVIGEAANDGADGAEEGPLDSPAHAPSELQEAMARFVALGAIQAARREIS